MFYSTGKRPGGKLGELMFNGLVITRRGRAVRAIALIVLALVIVTAAVWFGLHIPTVHLTDAQFIQGANDARGAQGLR